jgi:hypothetical protein
MKKFKLLYLALGLISLGLVGCQKQELQVATPEKEVVTAKDKAVLAVVDLLNQQINNESIIGELTSNPLGQKLDYLVSNLKQTSGSEQAIQTLRDYVASTNEVNKLSEKTGYLEIPELWLYQPKVKTGSSEILVTYVPDGNEKSWKNIKAYNLKKEVVYLDVKNEPNVRVIVLETNGSAAMKVKVDYMNKALQKAGLQSPDLPRKRISAKAAGIETTKLTKIRLNNDQEPWIKGAAEIYAITSGLRDVSGTKTAQITIVDMPYLDYDGTDYYPNQLMLFWPDYSYQAANIQLYEQDSNYNYQQLIVIIINGVTTVAGTISAQPWINALGTLASAIVNAMPADWLTDNDDYVDSYYTIMKNTTYTDYMGAGANAKVTLVPFFVPAN